MKLSKLLLVVITMLVPSASFAWEHPMNPDRFPSLGFTYSGSAEDGEFTSAGTRQDVEVVSGGLFLDTRLPLSNSFTLSFGLGAVGSNVKGKDSPTLFSSESDTSGGSFFISGRYYFNR